MPHIITIGKRLIPLDEIALVEPYEVRQDSELRTKREFRSRAVLVNRESLLLEETQEQFAKSHAFRWLAADQTALNPAIKFRVERFEAAEGFTPTKPYRTRLRWYDADADQSKLLLTPAEEVLEVLGSPVDVRPLPPRGSGGSSKLRRARRNGRALLPPAQP